MRRAVRWAILFVLSAAGAASAQSVTLLRFDSEPGDFIGQGQQFTLTPSDGTITAVATGGGARVSFNGSRWWDLFFVPPSGRSLSPGEYEGARRWPFQSSTTPGLSVYGDGRGCNTVTGRFMVLEAEFGTDGSVVRLAVDYEQHCEGGAPALHGSVRYNSSVSLGPRLAAGGAKRYEGDSGTSSMGFVISLSAPAQSVVTVGYQTVDGTATGGSDYQAVSGTATFPVGETAVTVPVSVFGDAVEESDETFTLTLSNAVGAPIAYGEAVGTILNDDPYKTLIRFDSQPGDWVGAGGHFTLTQTDGTITAGGASGGVQVHFAGSTWWDLYFVPGSGQALAPGVYEGATRWPFQSSTSPGLSVSGDGRGCNMLTGRFTVLEAEYDTSGNVARFAVDYEQHCEGGAPALFGSVRYNSSASLGPRLGVGGATGYEGDSGSSTMSFVVSLSAPAQSVVTVDYQTVDGTATAGSDYQSVAGTVSFPVGQTAVTVPVSVLGDVVEESDETFTLSLSNPVGAPIAYGKSAGTIRNDDPYKTLIRFDSQPGDYIGGGGHFTLTQADGTITASGANGGVQVHFSGSTWWDLIFVPRSGVILVPGAYDGATRSQSPTAPGLSVSGDGRGCNTLAGRFTVLEAEYGTNGTVVRFAVDYEQHCEGGAPALYGSVRYNSSVPLGPRVAVGSVTQYEGDSGTSIMGFVISLSAPAQSAVSVDYRTVDGTATAGSDYQAVSGTASFSVGQTVVTVPVGVLGDGVEETDETFSLSLSNAVGAPLAFGEAVGTILNDDPYKTLIRFDSQPGDYIGGGGHFTLTPVDGTITASGASGGVHVGFSGSTWWDLYFVPPSGQALAPGVFEGATRWPFQSPRTPGLSVYGAGRGCNTLTGRFTVFEAEYGTNGTVVRFAVDYEQHCEGGASALYGSVRYNSAVPLGPSLAVGGLTRYEGDSGTSSMGFVISLSAPAQSIVTVDYQTIDGTATAGSDYQAVSGTASFPVGQTMVTVPVNVFGDMAEEADETFSLSLSNAVGAPVSFGSAVGTILNDDPYKTLIYFNSQPGDWVGGGRRYTLTEADGTFTANPYGGGVHVGFSGSTWWDVYLVAPSGGQLTPGVYLGAERWPFQPAGAPGLSVYGDGRGCNTLTGRFTVLEAEYATNGDVVRFAADYEQHCEGGASALFGSVRFRSSVPRVLRLFVAGASALEGNKGTRNLDLPTWLSEPGDAPVTASFATRDGTALQGIDYAGYAGSTTLPAGQVNGVIHVPVFGDVLAEANETFFLNLLGVTGAAAQLPMEVTGTILDDDPLPRASVGDVLVTEGNPGAPVTAGFVVSLDAPSGQTVSVSYATQQGSATQGEDYTYTSGTLTIAPGSTSGTISVPIVPDLTPEPSETFSLLLFSPTNATLANSRATGTIVDDDQVAATSYFTLPPCRLLDTRETGPALVADVERVVPVAGVCGVPSNVKSVVLNVTSVDPASAGYFQVYASGTTAPDTLVVAFPAGRTRAAFAMVRTGVGGEISMMCRMPGSPTGNAHAVVDVFGYFR